MRVDLRISELEFGLFPDKAAEEEIQIKLNTLEEMNQLKTINSVGFVDSRKYDEYGEKIKLSQNKRVEYQGKIYERVKVNTCFDGNPVTFSNKEHYLDGDDIWMELNPIQAYLDEESGLVIPKKIIFAGIPFHHERNYQGDFEKTDIYEFWKKYLIPEIFSMAPKQNIEIATTKKTRLQKLNPDSSKIEERQNMTDTELIHDWIESGSSVLLRGPSGIGKTERIKKLYPDLVYLKLTDNMFPEKVVGSMNLQTGESIPPDFAKQIILAGSTEEEKKQIKENIQNIYDIASSVYERSKKSTKKQVILLDELLNVKPVIQSLVYTLVLNKIVEINGGLQLPENVVIVATGNQKKYSSVAHNLAEPLEKRFDHIFDMEPKVGEWISEYAIPNQIHPSVLGFIFSNYLQNKKSEKDIAYFYEEPEIGEKRLDRYGCHGRTNDPRGWVSISNTLYAFEQNLKTGKYRGKNVEQILEVSLNTKLREEWAREFYNFYNISTLSIPEIIEKNYQEEDLPQNINERFSYVYSLLQATEEEVSACRDFIKEYCDPEYLELYDLYWAGNDINRMMKITELDELSEEKRGIRL